MTVFCLQANYLRKRSCGSSLLAILYQTPDLRKNFVKTQMRKQKGKVLKASKKVLQVFGLYGARGSPATPPSPTYCHMILTFSPLHTISPEHLNSSLLLPWLHSPISHEIVSHFLLILPLIRHLSMLPLHRDFVPLQTTRTFRLSWFLSFVILWKQ